MSRPLYQPGTPAVDAWETHAACRRYNPELWFPVSCGNARAVATPVSICHRCPVQTQCLDKIMAEEKNATTKHRTGIWAGTTPEDRYRLYRRGYLNQAVTS